MLADTRCITFVTLEGEYGMVNVVVYHELAERQRRVLVGSQLMQVDNHLEEKSGVRHVIAGRLHEQPGFPLAARNVRHG